MPKAKILRIGHLSTFYHTSFVLMGTRWLEEQLNVNVQWSMFGGGPAIVEAFARDDVDIGYIGLPPVMIGIDRGVPLVCVGGGHVEGTVMLGPPDSRSLDEMGDMKAVLKQYKGGVIGCPPSGSIHDVIIRDLLSRYGLGNSITVKNYQWADFIPDALAEHEVDAAIGTPPLYVAASNAFGARVIIPPSQLWPWNPSYGIIVRQSLLEADPGLVEGFLGLHEDASNLIRDHPHEAAQIVSRVVEVVDSDFIKQAYQISPKYCASLPREYIDSTMNFVPVLMDLGYIELRLQESDIFNTSLIERVHRDKHHYF